MSGLINVKTMGQGLKRRRTRSREALMFEEEILFDEFGNYIGPEIQYDKDENSMVEENFFGENLDEALLKTAPGIDTSIVLHEDKSFYPSARQIYGEDVETIVEYEDRQPLTQPIVVPNKELRFEAIENPIPISNEKVNYIQSRCNTPDRVRNVSIVGHYQHGKTGIADLLLLANRPTLTPYHFRVDENDNDTLISLELKEEGSRLANHMDRTKAERSRRMTIHSKPFSVLLPDSRGTHYVINAFDCPGHTDMTDQVDICAAATDGFLIAVDCVEGVTMSTRRLIDIAILNSLPMVLVITKFERLILELRIPPTDAYLKLKHIIDNFNTYISETYDTTIESLEGPSFMCPTKGNVLFSSALGGYIFSLKSFARAHLKSQNSSNNSINDHLESQIAEKIWGNHFYDIDTGFIYSSKGDSNSKRRYSFVQLVMEPIYKIYALAIGEERASLEPALKSIGVYLRPLDYSLNSKPLIRRIFSHFFPSTTSCIVDALVMHLKNPLQTSKKRLVQLANIDDKTFWKFDESSNPLLAHVIKLIPRLDGSVFDAVVRIHSGFIKLDQMLSVKSMDGGGTKINFKVHSMFLSGGRDRIPITFAGTGAIILIPDLDAFKGTATLMSMEKYIPENISANEDEKNQTEFKPIAYSNFSSIKVAIEPVIPADLPRMLTGLRRLQKVYPQLEVYVEESGEHVLVGTGELSMDCALHDLRRVYCGDSTLLGSEHGVEIRVADPVCRFSESIGECSRVPCVAFSANGKNRISIIAEPVDPRLVEALSRGENIDKDRLVSEFYWDILSASNLWAIGPSNFNENPHNTTAKHFNLPDVKSISNVKNKRKETKVPITRSNSTNLLIDDTLAVTDGADKEALNKVRHHLIQGFQWACREGPLIEEAMRGVQFRIISAEISRDSASCGAGQLIPAMRRACLGAFLVASPRILEPVAYAEIIVSQGDFSQAVYDALAKRRGHVISETRVAATPLTSIEALVPVMDTFGLETDVRIGSQGSAYTQYFFSMWQPVPGDPLDGSTRIIPLEPSPAPLLARDYFVKTRRRKGLPEDLAIEKFFDNPDDLLDR